MSSLRRSAACRIPHLLTSVSSRLVSRLAIPALLLLAACTATPARKSVDLPDPRSPQVLRGDTGVAVPWSEFVASVAQSGAIAIGENHGHPLGLATAAALWSDVLALAPQSDDAIAVTVSLSVAYVKRTPIGVPLRFEGRVTSEDGRKVVAQGVCIAAGEVTARAEGVFVRVPRSRFEGQ